MQKPFQYCRKGFSVLPESPFRSAEKAFLRCVKAFSGQRTSLSGDGSAAKRVFCDSKTVKRRSGCGCAIHFSALCDISFAVSLCQKKLPTTAMISCSHIAECSLFYSKTVPVSAMKACFHIAECSLFYSKTVPVSAMKACFHIAECSLFYKNEVNPKRCFHAFRAVFPAVR